MSFSLSLTSLSVCLSVCTVCGLCCLDSMPLQSSAVDFRLSLQLLTPDPDKWHCHGRNKSDSPSLSHPLGPSLHPSSALISPPLSILQSLRTALSPQAQSLTSQALCDIFHWASVLITLLIWFLTESISLFIAISKMKKKKKNSPHHPKFLVNKSDRFRWDLVLRLRDC